MSSHLAVRQVKYEYDWVKPSLASPLRRAGRVNASDRNSTSGSTDFTLTDQPGPEVRRLGVRVVDPEDLHPVVHPVPNHPQHLVVEAGRIVVEVQRVDVLVLLRGFSA